MRTKQRRSAHAERKRASIRKELARYRDGKGSARVEVSRAKARLKALL